MTDPLTKKMRVHLFEMAVALAWVLVGLQWFTDPAGTSVRSPVTESFEWQPMWALLEMVGGVAVLVALVRGETRLRVAGLAVLAGGIAMNGLAATLSPAFDLRIFVYWIYAAACATRAIYCYRKAVV